jgi:hypothetical protein
MQTWKCLLLVTALVVAVTACGGSGTNQPKNDLVGKWEQAESYDYPDYSLFSTKRFELLKDGIMVVGWDGYALTYSVIDGSRMKFDAGSRGQFVYPFQLVDDTLIFKDERSREVVYRRVTKPVAPIATTKRSLSAADVELIARVIASEAGSIFDFAKGAYVEATETERAAVGWTILNRLAAAPSNSLSAILGGQPSDGKCKVYACGQQPTQQIHDLAQRVVDKKIADPTKGATHFFSPISMPWEGEEGGYITRLRAQFGDFDTRGGVQVVPGLPKRVYFPSWATTMEAVGNVGSIRPTYFMFYRSKVSASSSQPSSLVGAAQQGLYQELLSLLPDNPYTRTMIQVNDYALLRKIGNVSFSTGLNAGQYFPALTGVSGTTQERTIAQGPFWVETPDTASSLTIRIWV